MGTDATPPTVRGAPRTAGAVAVLVGLLVAALAALTSVAARVDAALFDAQVHAMRAVQPRAAEEVVLVGIDDATLQQFRDPFALSHAWIGAALERVTEAGARLIVLDVVLPDRSYEHLRPGLELALFRGLRRAREVGLVVAREPDRDHGRSVLPLFAEAAGTEAFGLALYPEDVDGVVRRFDPRLGADASAPTLVGLTAQRLRVNVQPGLIDWTLGAPFTYLPLKELAPGSSPDLASLRARVGGKVVVIGTVERFADRVPQPLNLAGWEAPGTTPPGVLLHAQALRTVLHGGFIRPVPAWFIWTVVTGAAALGFIRSLSLRWLTMAAVVLLAPVAAAGALRAGWHVGLGVVLLAAAAATIARTAIDSWWHRRERLRLARMFRGYVSPQVLEAMLDGRLAPQEGRTELGFLFADLRGFSAMSESLPPDEVLRLLNRYYAAVTPVIHAHGGTIDNFRGDGVMAIFGAPRAADNPAADAIGAALAVHAAVDRLNAELAAEGKPPVVAGIGVACGPAVVGDLGSDDRKDYSAIGDAVVVAARLQDLAKDLGFAVVASTQALDAAGLAAERRGEFEALGEQSLKGHRAVAVAGWKRVNIRHAAA